MPTIDLILNGPVTVLDQRPTNVTPTSEKGKALLVMLATAGRNGRSRAWLQSILWPEASSAANLRNELSVLRRHFDSLGVNPIKATKKMVFLDYEVCRTDIDNWESEVRKLDLAEGLDIKVPEFDEWLTQERSYWRDGLKQAGMPQHIEIETGLVKRRLSTPLLYVPKIDADVSMARQCTVVHGLTEELLTSLGSLISFFDVTTDEPSAKAADVYRINISVRGDASPRITTQLISHFSKRVIWTGRFDLHEGEVFDAQEKIARKIIENFQERLTDGAWSKIWTQKTTVTEAWETFQVGRQFEAMFNPVANLQAIKEYEKVLEIDPSFYPAVIAKGFCLADQIRLGWAENVRDCLVQILALLKPTLQSNPNDAYALALEAYSVFLGGRKSAGLAMLEDVVMENPFSPEIIAYLGAMLGHDGKILREIQKYMTALTLTSYPPAWILSNLAISQATILDASALVTAERALGRNPNGVRARIAKICALVTAGESVEAKECARELVELEPEFSAGTWSHKDIFTVTTDFDRVANMLKAAGL